MKFWQLQIKFGGQNITYNKQKNSDVLHNSFRMELYQPEALSQIVINIFENSMVIGQDHNITKCEQSTILGKAIAMCEIKGWKQTKLVKLNWAS